TYPTEIVLAKSIERKPVAVALLATPKRGAKAGGRRSVVPSFLPIASQSEALQPRHNIIQPFWFVTLHLHCARLILQMADELFARFGFKTSMSFAHRVGPDRR